MAQIDIQYKGICEGILEHGYIYYDKSRKINCKQLSYAMLDIDIKNGIFPLITLKDMSGSRFNSIVTELKWFLKGDTNIKYLNDNGVHIWDKDAANFGNTGNVGRNYGAQWRDWTGDMGNVDQIQDLLENLKENPMSRRHIVTAWNPNEIGRTALPPCHWSFQVMPRPLYEFEKEEYWTDEYEPEYGFILQWNQRSVDVFLGLPFNIASYALLAYWIGDLTNMVPMGLVGMLNNLHLYDPHLEAARELTKRSAIQFQGPSISWKEGVEIESLEDIYDLEVDLVAYKSFPSIKAEMIAPIKN